MTQSVQVLHIGVEPAVYEPLSQCLSHLRWQVEGVVEVERCLHLLEEGRGSLLLVGRQIRDLSMEHLLETALRKRLDLTAAVLVGDPDYQEAVRLAGYGAAAYIPIHRESFDPDAVAAALHELPIQPQATAAPAREHEQATPIVGRSKAAQDVVRLVRLIAPRQCTVLISGATGTGKELVARAIHRFSPRVQSSLVVVNCGAVPESLMESEFFGHTKGALPGPQAPASDGLNRLTGTPFLDEVGELSLEMQGKLLRALQEREFQRLGSSETVRADVRVIAATNRDLNRMVESGAFREDLFYRLNVVPVRLPTLAERPDDVPLLAAHLLERICERENLREKRISPETLARLRQHSWPGNVRQLENAIDKAVALSGDRTLLYPSDFPLPPMPRNANRTRVPEIALPTAGLDFDTVITEIERSLLAQALKRTGGNKKRAAELLRIKRTTFAARWQSLQPAQESSRDGVRWPE